MIGDLPSSVPERQSVRNEDSYANEEEVQCLMNDAKSRGRRRTVVRSSVGEASGNSDEATIGLDLKRDQETHQGRVDRNGLRKQRSPSRDVDRRRSLTAPRLGTS